MTHESTTYFVQVKDKGVEKTVIVPKTKQFEILKEEDATKFKNVLRKTYPDKEFRIVTKTVTHTEGEWEKYIK
jgi:uncharacterized protein YfdQ (DUF2303 family)